MVIKMNKNKKIIIGILIVVFIIIIGIVVAYKLIENSVTNRENFNFKVENISPNPVDTIKHENNEHSFYGKVVESDASYIIVEPNEDEEERKSADKISIGLDQNNDAIYMVGTNVKIVYDGTIKDSYPAQVKATKIELKSVENFEIFFYDKQPQSDIKLHKIVNKNETDKYDYDVYVYDGSVNISIDGTEHSLKEALLENKITMNQIIEKANQDEKDGIVKVNMYQDGGSMEYHYDKYTIIKCHTLDGNRDVYIGNKDLNINEVI